MKLRFLDRLQALAQPAAPTVADERATATVAAVRADLPELLAVAVIDLGSGHTLAAYSSTSGLAPAKAAPFNAEVINQQRKALLALNMPDERIEDILITLREQLHLLRVSTDNQRALYLAVRTHDTNLALARGVLYSHSD